MKTGASKYWWPWVAVIALLALYGVNWAYTPEIVGITRLESFFRPKGKLQFDSDKWKETSTWGERYEMVDDLLRRRLRMGLSLQEVEDLLGKPDISARRDAGELEVHYSLASQKDYPARSLLFIGRLENLELWVLLLRFRDSRLYSVEIVPS